MIERVVHGMGGISIFGVISLCIFCAIFTCVFFWCTRLKKPYLDTMGALPLEGNPTPESQTTSESPEKL